MESDEKKALVLMHQIRTSFEEGSDCGRRDIRGWRRRRRRRMRKIRIRDYEDCGMEE
jgi:hypothetical protein